MTDGITNMNKRHTKELLNGQRAISKKWYDSIVERTTHFKLIQHFMNGLVYRTG